MWEKAWMWPRQSTWICGEKVGLNGIIYGMIRSWKVYWKLGIIFITTFFATSVCSQTKRFRSKDQIWWSLIRGRKVAIPEDCGLWAKENGKVEKRQDLATVVQKNIGSNDKSCAEVVGALGTVPLRLKGNNLTHLGVDKSMISLLSRNRHCWVLQRH